MFSPVTLEGSSVTLVPLENKHLEPLCALGLDPRLWAGTILKVSTREQMEKYVRDALDARQAGHALPFAIQISHTREIVGTTRFHTAVPEHRRVGIGFTWISIPWQRTSVNTESKLLMLQHAFEQMKCVRVEFIANSKNEQSRRALRRVGATEEGILRRYRVGTNEDCCDVALFSVVDDEWSQVKAALIARLAAHSSVNR